jgi:hypothetical protein
VVSIFATIPATVLLLFKFGVTSDAVFIIAIVIFEVINVYCLLSFFSLYKKFQNGMPLTNEV